MTKNTLAGIETIDLNLHFKDLVEFRIPIGIKAIDLVIGGGIPAGKLSEFYGSWSSGKTRLACRLAANTIKLGGAVVFLDNEKSLSKGLLDLTGVDPKHLIYPNPDTELKTLEKIFTVMENSIVQLREADPDRLITVIWDSVATAPCKQDLEAEIGQNHIGAATRARIISNGLKKIMSIVHSTKTCLVFLNQIRDKIGVQYGAKTDTVGGKSIKFQASLRIHCKIVGAIKNDKTKEKDGDKGQIIVEKSKISKPFGVVNFEMLATEPIDEYAGLLDYYVRHGKVESKGGWFNFVGEKKKFRSYDFPEALKKYEEENEKLKS